LKLTHTRTHKYIHTHSYTSAHIHTHTHTLTLTHTHTHMHTHTHTRTHTHNQRTHTQTHTHTCVPRNLVQMLGSARAQDGSSLTLLSEFSEGGDLLQLLNEEQRLRSSRQVCVYVFCLCVAKSIYQISNTILDIKGFF